MQPQNQQPHSAQSTAINSAPKPARALVDELLGLESSNKLKRADRVRYFEIIDRAREFLEIDGPDSLLLRATVSQLCNRLYKEFNGDQSNQERVRSIFSDFMLENDEYAHVIFGADTPELIGLYCLTAFFNLAGSNSLKSGTLFSEGKERIFERLRSSQTPEWQVIVGLLVAMPALPDYRHIELFEALDRKHLESDKIAKLIFLWEREVDIFVRYYTASVFNDEPTPKLSALIKSEIKNGRDPRRSPRLVEILAEPTSPTEFNFALRQIDTTVPEIIPLLSKKVLLSPTLASNLRDSAFKKFVVQMTGEIIVGDPSAFCALYEQMPKTIDSRFYLSAVLASRGIESALEDFINQVRKKPTRLDELHREVGLNILVHTSNSKAFVDFVKQRVFESTSSILPRATIIDCLVKKSFEGELVVSKAELTNFFERALRIKSVGAHWKGNVLTLANLVGVELSIETLTHLGELKTRAPELHKGLINYIAPRVAPCHGQILENLENCQLESVTVRAKALRSILSQEVEEMKIEHELDFEGTQAIDLLLAAKPNKQFDRLIVDEILSGRLEVRFLCDARYQTELGSTQIEACLKRERTSAEAKAERPRHDGIVRLLDLLKRSKDLHIRHPFRFSVDTLEHIVTRREQLREQRSERKTIMIGAPDDEVGALFDLERHAALLIASGYDLTYYEPSTFSDLARDLAEFRSLYPCGADLCSIHCHSNHQVLELSSSSESGRLWAFDRATMRSLGLAQTIAMNGQFAILGCGGAEEVPQETNIATEFSYVLHDRPDISIAANDRLTYAKTFALSPNHDGNLRFEVRKSKHL